MKKLMLVAVVVVAIGAAFAFTYQLPVEKGIGRVNRVEGYYIFIQSTPVAEYDVLGTVKKIGIVWSGSPSEMFNTLLRRMKKDYPKADGIIFEDVSMDRGTCIQFK